MSVVANRSINKGEEMTDEKILTKHSLGKTGRNIDREKYDTLDSEAKKIIERTASNPQKYRLK
jgi:hypothetical protein